MAKLSSRYAAALFELVMEDGKPEEVLPQVIVLRDTLSDHSCRRVLVHPHISSDDKRELFESAFAGKLNSHLLAFIRLVIDKNRESFATPALTELIGMLHKHMKIATAKVTSPDALSANQIEKMKKLLEDKLDKKVEFDIKTDPAVIGGASVQVDGYFFDQTVKRRLSKLKERCGA
jgi:F-type H+-transporting ATPase subunit delta